MGKRKKERKTKTNLVDKRQKRTKDDERRERRNKESCAKTKQHNVNKEKDEAATTNNSR